MRRLAPLAAGMVLLATGVSTAQGGRPAEAATSLPRTTLTAVPRDLGTLGGRSSSATDIDGGIVVGRALTAGGPEHAFAYDLAAGRMRDLGTLGGADSGATAVDGNVVVGDSLTPSGVWHAFAYDLTTGTMRDLGTLFPGGFSRAVDVDGGVVVGMSGSCSAPYCTSGHAFAYDLATGSMRALADPSSGGSTVTGIDGGTVVGTADGDPGHALVYDLGTSSRRDLGDVGYPYSEAVDVDGPVVVGNSYREDRGDEDGDRSSFAYDLSAASPAARDLGDLGVHRTYAAAVEGRTVVGTSATSWRGRPVVFSMDLSTSTSRMRNRGGLGGPYVSVADLRDGVVVGQAARAGDGRMRPFALDLRSSRPEITDLGTLGGADGSAVAVVGRTVVGTSTNTDGWRHATAWTLRTTTAPSFRFARLSYPVQENVGAARVTVLRYGNPSRAVSVRYAARDVKAAGHHDFTPVRGTLRFAAGQVRRTFSVPIRNDAAKEPAETFVLTLRSPSTGALQGTPDTAALVIRASDQRPDALIASQSDPRFVGNNVYNVTGAHQTKTAAARRTQTRSFPVLVTNDGNTSNTFVLRGTGSRPGATVRYFTGYRDVTAEMRSAGGWRAPLSPKGSHDLTVRITPRKSAKVSSVQTATVSATWRGDGNRVDVVKARVRVVR